MASANVMDVVLYLLTMYSLIFLIPVGQGDKTLEFRRGDKNRGLNRP